MIPHRVELFIKQFKQLCPNYKEIDGICLKFGLLATSILEYSRLLYDNNHIIVSVSSPFYPTYTFDIEGEYELKDDDTFFLELWEYGLEHFLDSFTMLNEEEIEVLKTYYSGIEE